MLNPHHLPPYPLWRLGGAESWLRGCASTPEPRFPGCTRGSRLLRIQQEHRAINRNREFGARSARLGPHPVSRLARIPSQGKEGAAQPTPGLQRVGRGEGHCPLSAAPGSSARAAPRELSGVLKSPLPAPPRQALAKVLQPHLRAPPVPGRDRAAWGQARLPREGPATLRGGGRAMPARGGRREGAGKVWRRLPRGSGRVAGPRLPYLRALGRVLRHLPPEEQAAGGVFHAHKSQPGGRGLGPGEARCRRPARRGGAARCSVAGPRRGLSASEGGSRPLLARLTGGLRLRLRFRPRRWRRLPPGRARRYKGQRRQVRGSWAGSGPLGIALPWGRASRGARRP